MLDYLIKQPYWKWFAYGIGGNVLMMQYYYYYYATPLLKTKLALSRQVSVITGQFSEFRVPRFMRSFLYRIYGQMYDVNFDDIVLDLVEFRNFQEFFTRAVKPRTFDQSEDKLICPADSRVLSITQIKGDETLLVKDKTYKLGYFLTGKQDMIIDDNILKQWTKGRNTNIYQVIFYLAPGDYHRYHSPAKFSIKSRCHVVGKLDPVKISHIEKKSGVYENNERVILFGQYVKGFMCMAMVGALNVGSIFLNYDIDFATNQWWSEELHKYIFYQKNIQIEKGEQVGMFKLGSTVVLIFEAEEVKWLVEPGQKVRWGDVYAEVK